MSLSTLSPKPLNPAPLPQVSLSTPMGLSASTYATFLTLCTQPGSSMSLDGSSVPLMYPIVEAFRLVMQCLLMPQFPFNVLGSVLGRNTAVLHRPLSLTDKLLYRWVGMWAGGCSCSTGGVPPTQPHGQAAVQVGG